MTNGLGGFSSLSMIGSCSRNDHAVFMACEHSPNYRINMIHRLEETLELGGRNVHLSSQDYQSHERRKQGYLYQSSFIFEAETVKLNIVPHLQFVAKEVRVSSGQVFEMTDKAICSNGHTMYYRTNGQCREVASRFCDTLYYAHDVCDGKTALGRSVVVQEISFEVKAGTEKTLEII